MMHGYRYRAYMRRRRLFKVNRLARRLSLDIRHPLLIAVLLRLLATLHYPLTRAGLPASLPLVPRRPGLSILTFVCMRALFRISLVLMIRRSSVRSSSSRTPRSFLFFSFVLCLSSLSLSSLLWLSRHHPVRLATPRPCVATEASSTRVRRR